MGELDEILEQGTGKGQMKHKRFFVVICIASAVVAMGIFVLLVNGYVNKHYNHYEVIRQTERKDTNTEQYICPEGHLIKYSRDGIAEITSTGKTVWSGSYDMSNPQVVSCGNYTLVADIGGKEAHIYNGQDTGTELSLDYEIKQACVSRQGVVALLLEDSTSDTINIYNPYDVSSKLLAEIPTNVDDGYPLCIALSQDGTSVVASYLCATKGKLETKVAFYNFSEVGKNSDCLVGAKNYEDILITDIRFLEDDQVCLFSGEGYYVWRNMKQPQQIRKKKVKGQIKSIFYNKKYIGLILEDESRKLPYQMQIYNQKGKRITDFAFDNNYDSVELVGNEILLYGAKECSIFRLNGVQRFQCTVEEGISYFFRASRSNRYYLLDDSRIQEIKLTAE